MSDSFVIASHFELTKSKQQSFVREFSKLYADNFGRRTAVPVGRPAAREPLFQSCTLTTEILGVPNIARPIGAKA